MMLVKNIQSPDLCVFIFMRCKYREQKWMSPKREAYKYTAISQYSAITCDTTAFLGQWAANPHETELSQKICMDKKKGGRWYTEGCGKTPKSILNTCFSSGETVFSCQEKSAISLDLKGEFLTHTHAKRKY